jgi:hypothetical protein
MLVSFRKVFEGAPNIFQSMNELCCRLIDLQQKHMLKNIF